MEPTRLLPMLATPGVPADVVGPGWAHEFKWDGARALVVSDGVRLQLRSRQGNDITAAYPELQGLAAAVGPGVLLDGEIIAHDADGRPSFAALQPRMHVRDTGRAQLLAASVPVTLVLFDLLLADGAWLLDTAYEDRRERLEASGLHGPAWATPPRTDDLATALTVASERGLEGVVSKRLGSHYHPGRRSRDWRKLRLLCEQEFVVGGYRRGRGRRAGEFGALLVGTYDDNGDLRYAGGVGTGYTDRELRRLADLLAPRHRATAPFVDPPRDSDAVWVEPDLVVQVRFTEWTPDGRLRQPVYRGQRTDKDPRSIRRDT
jgi:bifunctional non-homologous end joining protein LigD